MSTLTSAIGGKADDICWDRAFPLMTRSGPLSDRNNRVGDLPSAVADAPRTSGCLVQTRAEAAVPIVIRLTVGPAHRE